MVLSYNEPPYDSLMRMQQATFDSIEVEGVRSLYYHGSRPDEAKVVLSLSCNTWERVGFLSTDDYYFMAGKFKDALNYVKDWDYDIIFRTNSSSYVNKQRLKEFAATLPTEKLYAGWEIEGNAGYNVVSGAGIFLSRDTAEILREKIDPNFEREEDVFCGQLLHEAGIKIINDRSRFDVENVNDRTPLNRYHYRQKASHGNRLQDAENMRLLHQKIIVNE